MNKNLLLNKKKRKRLILKMKKSNLWWFKSHLGVLWLSLRINIIKIKTTLTLTWKQTTIMKLSNNNNGLMWQPTCKRPVALSIMSGLSLVKSLTHLTIQSSHLKTSPKSTIIPSAESLLSQLSPLSCPRKKKPLSNLPQKNNPSLLSQRMKLNNYNNQKLKLIVLPMSMVILLTKKK